MKDSAESIPTRKSRIFLKGDLFFLSRSNFLEVIIFRFFSIDCPLVFVNDGVAPVVFRKRES
jgi:hypothetical protein